MAFIGVDHVVIRVKDRAEAVERYRALGLEPRTSPNTPPTCALCLTAPRRSMCAPPVRRRPTLATAPRRHATDLCYDLPSGVQKQQAAD